MNIQALDVIVKYEYSILSLLETITKYHNL